MILQYLGFTENGIIDSDENDTERKEIGRARFYGVFYYASARLRPEALCCVHPSGCPVIRLSVRPDYIFFEWEVKAGRGVIKANYYKTT